MAVPHEWLLIAVADPQVIEAYLGKGAAARMKAEEAVDA